MHPEPESQPLRPNPAVNAPPSVQAILPARVSGSRRSPPPHQCGTRPSCCYHPHPPAPTEGEEGRFQGMSGGGDVLHESADTLLPSSIGHQAGGCSGVPDISARLLPRWRGPRIRKPRTGVGLDKSGLGGGPEGPAECRLQWTWAEADAGCPRPSSPLAGVSPLAQRPLWDLHLRLRQERAKPARARSRPLAGVLGVRP